MLARTTTILSMLLLLSMYQIQAQKKVLEKPQEFAKPIDESDQFYNYNNLIKKDRIKDNPWEVYSDRVGNATEEGDSLEFKKSYYVVDETDTKIKVVSALLDGIKVTQVVKNHGWIEKKKMLLWSDVLIDPNTKIQRKGFLLNTKESLERIIIDPKDKSKVRIYDRPDLLSAKEIEKNRIYEFYFIIKKEKVRSVPVERATSKDYMYLLSRNVRVGGVSIFNDLVGWVQGDRIDEWNTRIALEPNYNLEAIEERKANDNKDKILAFTLADEAKDYAFSGRYDVDNVLWDNDPVHKSSEKMADSNPYRFRGGVIRFPMLKKDSTNNFFKTAIVGEITLTSLRRVVGEYDIIEYANILAEVHRLNKARQNVNIIYLIEGNKKMAKYAPTILSSIDSIKYKIPKDVQLKFGAAVYKDYKENVPYNVFQKQELTTKLKDVRDFVSSIEYDVYGDPNQSVAFYYGLKNCLKKMNMREDQTNIIVHIGQQQDIEFDAGEDVDETFITDFYEIVDGLADTNVHFVSANVGAPNELLKEQVSSILLETAKTNYNEYKNIGNLIGLDFSNPELEDFEGTSILTNGTTYGRFDVVSDEKGLANVISEGVISAKRYVDGIILESNKIFEDGKQAYERGTAGQFGPAIADIIVKNLAFLDEDEVKKILKEKYQLYFRAYAPVRMLKNEYENFTYVLFMPEEDLESLSFQLHRLSNSIGDTPDKKREALIRVWKELVLQFTGEDESKIMNMDLLSIEQKMQGIKNEGIRFNTNKPLSKMKLKDLNSKKKISDAQIDDYINSIKDKYDNIQEIIQLGKSYDFAYSSNGFVYYWIPSSFLP